MQPPALRHFKPWGQKLEGSSRKMVTLCFDTTRLRLLYAAKCSAQCWKHRQPLAVRTSFYSLQPRGLFFPGGITWCPVGASGPDAGHGMLPCHSLTFFSPAGCPREREEEHEGGKCLALPHVVQLRSQVSLDGGRHVLCPSNSVGLEHDVLPAQPAFVFLSCC